MRTETHGYSSDLRKIIPIECRGFLLNEDNIFDDDEYRSLLGMATKYILHPNQWNCSNLTGLRSFKEKTFEGHSAVEPMVKAFEAFQSDEMQKANPLNRCLKAVVKYKHGLSRANCKRRIRKKRLTQFRKEMLHVFRLRYPKPKKPCQGITYFLFSVRRQFFLAKRGRR